MKKLLMLIVLMSTLLFGENLNLVGRAIYFPGANITLNLYEDFTLIGNIHITDNNNRFFSEYQLEEDKIIVDFGPMQTVLEYEYTTEDSIMTNLWGPGNIVNIMELSPLRNLNKREAEEFDVEIEEYINTMSLEEKVGQMFTVGIWGDERVEDRYLEFLDENHIGGVILYSRNVLSHNHAIDIINELKINNDSDIPLLVAVDNEGAFRINFPRTIPVGLPNSLLVNEIDAEDNYDVGKEMGKLLSRIGINMNYGTIVDLDYDDGNVGMMTNRAYGSNASLVADYAINYSEGNKDAEVVPVYKHFPGHGKTTSDSHVTLPILNLSYEELQNELKPYKIAIEEDKVEAIMTAHIILENIDKENPATLSKKVLTGILREELGYEGVIITDDIEMGAIKDYYNIEEAVVRAVEAGTDIILVCHTYENQQITYNSLLNAVKDGRISEDRINQSVYRILKLKKNNNYSNETNKYIEVEEYSNELKEFLEEYKILI